MTFEEAFKNDPQARAEFHEYLDEMAEEHVHVAVSLHDRSEPDPAGVQLENRRPGGELVKSWDDPQDPEHDPIGDAETDYDIEVEEDDGQPTEYEEWQDFMGGDDWDFGQCDEGGY